MAALRHLLLLGGGHAHVHVLKSLAEQALPRACVTLVTPYRRQMYSGMVPGLVAAHYREQDCVIPLAPLAQRAGVRFIDGAGASVDAAARRVRLAGGELLSYDLLSIDTGPVMDRAGIAGAAEHGLFVRPIELFVRELDGLAALAARQVLSLAVVGGGSAGVELALAFAHRLNRNGGDRARLTLVCAEAPPLPGYPSRVRRLALRALARLGVTVLQERCVEIGAHDMRTSSGARRACDKAILAIGPSAPAWVRDSGLATDAAGFVATGPSLQSRSHPEVFAVGDVASRTDAAHPKSGVYAVRAGPPLAHNLRAWLAGEALKPHHPPRRTLNLISCGARRAIASWGPWSAEGAWVWYWKDQIDRGFVARYGGLAERTVAPG